MFFAIWGAPAGRKMMRHWCVAILFLILSLGCLGGRREICQTGGEQNSPEGNWKEIDPISDALVGNIKTTIFLPDPGQIPSQGYAEIKNNNFPSRC